ADEQLRQIVAGDVFHDFAAAAHERAVRGHDGDPDEEIARRSVEMTAGPRGVCGEHATECRAFRVPRIERQPLPTRPQRVPHPPAGAPARTPRWIPACAATARSPGSCSTTAPSRLRTRASPARAGGTPTPIALPPPHGTTGTEASADWATTAATSSTVPGNTAASGVRPSITYGDSSTPVRTWAGPTMARSLSSSDTTRPALEPLRQALRLDGVRAIRHGPRLDTRLPRGEHFAGVAQTPRVERILEALHQREVRRREDEGHEIGLLEADTVLAGNRASDLGAYLHDFGARRDHARLFARFTRIVEDVRMQVAVTRVEHIAHAQTVRGDDLVHPSDHIWQPGARDHAIHHHIGR